MVSPIDTDELLNRFKGEFVADTLDRLEQIEQMVETWRGGSLDDTELLAFIRREAHSIKGMGGTFGFPIISSIGHRLEDYLANVTEFTDRHGKDTYSFLDVLRDICAMGQDPGETGAAAILRKLPAKWSSKTRISVQAGLVEVLVGVKSKVLRSALEEELLALGYRVVSANSAFDVFKLTVANHPDAVIVTGVMEGLWGVDLIRALAAMDATKDIPVGLLTSFSDDKLDNLPANTVVIHTNPASFTEGLAELARHVKVDKYRAQG